MNTSVRDCGCTYRDTGLPSPQLPADVRLVDALADGATWGELCNALRCNTVDKRDALHRMLHRIATPTIVPEAGPGRKGTLWLLKT